MVKPEMDEAAKAATEAKEASSQPMPGHDPFGLADWLRDMPAGKLHPLMQHPAAAMAAATAVGIGMTSQFAGFMLGAMQGLAETAKKQMPVADAAQSAVQAVVETPVASQPPVAEAKVAPAVKPAVPKKAAAVKKATTAAKPQRAAKVADQKPVAPVVEAKAKPAARKSRARVDDLKAISGIGPKIEQVLKGMGVASYADIGGWSEADVTRIDEQLGFNGRIARDGWVEQARALAKSRT